MEQIHDDDDEKPLVMNPKAPIDIQGRFSNLQGHTELIMRMLQAKNSIGFTKTI